MEQKTFADLESRFVPGDVVRTGPNRYPAYRVVAVSADKVWLRNLTTGADAVVDCARCEVVEPSEKRTEARLSQSA